MVQGNVHLNPLQRYEQSPCIRESQPLGKTTNSLLCPNPNDSMAFSLALASIWILCLRSAISHPQF